MPRASAHGGMLIDRRESQLLATPFESLRGREDILLREASIGRPEKRCAVRLAGAPAAVRVCRGIRARKSGNQLTRPPALLAHQTAAMTHSAAFFELSPSGGLYASLRKTSSRPDKGWTPSRDASPGRLAAHDAEKCGEASLPRRSGGPSSLMDEPGGRSSVTRAPDEPGP